MTSFFYNCAIYLYKSLIFIVSKFNPKARLWIDGRKDWQEKLKIKINQHPQVFWFHAASLGEFEQGRPLLEHYRKNHPNAFILLTFFSPSGYEIRKHYALADYVCYLPIDTPKSARQFIQIVHPKLVFFIKYEFWFNYMAELKHQNIPLYLISGVFHERQVFFKPYGRWFASQLSAFKMFFLQNQASADYLSRLGYQNYQVVGDTRFDRVCQTAEQIERQTMVDRFTDGAATLVIGSSWPVDEAFIFPYLNARKQYKYIIAPHQIDMGHIEQIQKSLTLKSILWTDLPNEAHPENYQVLIVNTIGHLSSLYAYGHWAYIGGAFGSGLHNILEAAVFGLPVVFGPKTKKFPEAQNLILAGGAIQLKATNDWDQIADILFNDNSKRTEMGHNAEQFVKNSRGAVNSILTFIFK